MNADEGKMTLRAIANKCDGTHSCWYSGALRKAADLIETLLSQLAASHRRERAAVEDMKLIVDAVREEHCDETCCFACKFDCDTSITDSGAHACECPGFERDDCFEWRGPQAAGSGEGVDDGTPNVKEVSMTNADDQRIAEITARCEAATPGPWETALDVGKKYYIAPPSYGIRDFCYLSGGFDREQDASFIAHAREDIPYLLSQLAAKDAEIERLREAQRWRNAETEPPKCEDGAETGPILYRMKTTGTIEVGYYGRKGRWRDSYFRHMRNASDGVDADDVSDWMPLPVAIEKGE